MNHQKRYADAAATTSTLTLIVTKIDAMDQRNDARFNRLEERMDRVEQRLDQIDTRLDRIETRQDSMEQTLLHAIANMVQVMNDNHAELNRKIETIAAQTAAR